MVNLHKYIDLFLYLSFFIFVATQMIPAKVKDDEFSL